MISAILATFLLLPLDGGGWVGVNPPPSDSPHQGGESAAPTWYPSRNYPGWEGFGTPRDDYLAPERWRRTADPATELLPDGTVIAEATPPMVADPYGFTAWLNATRAAYGLPSVGHDPSLSSWAALNNSHQMACGLGHHVMGPARRQNAAMGSYPGIESLWMASSSHRAALLDPTIRWIGIAGSGAWWTFCAN